jgi:hypothetical protein
MLLCTIRRRHDTKTDVHTMEKYTAHSKEKKLNHGAIFRKTRAKTHKIKN